MAITFRAASASDIQVTNNSITLNKPTGTADGDLLIGVFTLDNGVEWTVNPPTLSGWTALGGEISSTNDGGELYCLYKIAASEGSSWTFTHNSNVRRTGQMFCFTGNDT